MKIAIKNFIVLFFISYNLLGGIIIKITPNLKKLQRIENQILFTNKIGYIENLQTTITESSHLNWKIENSKTTCEIPITLEKKINKNYGVIVYFKNLELPEGSSIIAYSLNGKNKTRKFFSNNNRLTKTFALPIVYGDKIIVKVELNTSTKNKFKMELDKVGIVIDDDNEGFGAAKDCFININCIEGADWKDQKRSVVKYVYTENGEIGKCTGALINNTLNDGKNLFLSAQHCGISATEEELGQTVFYFNYESKDCNNPPSDDNLNKQTVIGCKRIAASGPVHTSNQDFPDGSDFVLLEINPIPKEYNIYYSGWNRNDVGKNINGIGAIIQHPLADIKKISFWDTLKNSETSLSDFEAHCITVNNKGGAVEPMSSGSPVFDKDKRIVGTISYGSQGCVEGQEHPLVNGGKFFYHWDQNGNDKKLQLAPWLDPNNTGVMILDGKNTFTAVKSIEKTDKSTFSLSQNYPNPFNPVTTIKYTITHPSIPSKERSGRDMFVTLKIYNTLGKEVATLVNRKQAPGNYKVQFNANNLTSGIYIYKITIDGYSDIKKMILMK